MRFKLKKTESKIGDLKQFVKFALLPKKVEDYVVWLEHYKSLCEMKIINYYDFTYKKTWVEYDRRLMEKPE